MGFSGFWQTPFGDSFPFLPLPSEWRKCVTFVGEHLVMGVHNTRHLLSHKSSDGATIEACVSWADRHVRTAESVLGVLVQHALFPEWKRIIEREIEFLAKVDEELAKASAYCDDAPTANGFLVNAERHTQAAIVANTRLLDMM